MARLFLIRHGEPAQAWGDGGDPGLSEGGRAQARAAALTLAESGVTQVLCSPMRRCRETAAPFEAASGLAARIEPRVSEAAAPAGADRRAWLEAAFPWRPGAAPALWSAQEARLQAWRAAVIAAATEIAADAAVFTHFIAINVLVGAAGEDGRTIVARPAPASITELALEGGRLTLVRLGAQIEDGLVT